MIYHELNKNSALNFIFLLITIGLLWGCGTSDSTEVYELTANATPAEGGAVSPSDEEFEEGTTVQIEAEPSDEFLFSRWEGDITGTDNPHSFEITGDVDITAIFERKQYTLTVETEGAGSVEEEVIQAPKETDYDHGTVVQLTAIPEQSRVFTNWQGDLESQENPETLVIENEKTVTAVFNWGSPENEDCLALDPENVEIEELGDDWRLVEGNHALLVFDEFEGAKKGRDIIQFYEFSNSCYVKRPNPPMEYWLADGTPVQKSDDAPFTEDCIAVNTDNVEVEQSGDNWNLVDGNSVLLNFEELEAAEKARDTIQFYMFAQMCFVDRPNPDMQYWLR